MSIFFRTSLRMLRHVLSSGNVEYTSFPLQLGVAPKPQVLETPESYHLKDRGPVCAMEWSSDGYVLAVGWEKGWAIWSVSGRCLAWSFGSENQTDESRYENNIESVNSSTELRFPDSRTCS
jgi:RAB6A-GEF complex partner protein 1